MAKFKLVDVRLSFPDLWEPKEFEVGDGKPRYNAVFLIEPGSTNDKVVQAAVDMLVKEHNADKKLKALKDKDICYSDGDDKEYDGYAGMKVLSTHRRAQDGPPGVYLNIIDPATGKVAVAPATCGKPYAGCYVNATVEIYLTEGKYPGIRGGLVAVQFARDGDAFSGSSQPKPDDFEPLESGADADLV